jgi:hypothetical protein
MWLLAIIWLVGIPLSVRTAPLVEMYLNDCTVPRGLQNSSTAHGSTCNHTWHALIWRMLVLQVAPEGSYLGFWMICFFIMASILSGGRLHVVVMHLARHAYRKYYHRTDELHYNHDAPSEVLFPVGMSRQVSLAERGHTAGPPPTNTYVPESSAALKGELSMNYMNQVT